MESKPTYEELYRRVKELEDDKDRIANDAVTSLTNTEAKFQAILDTVDVHMSLIDRDLNIVWANRATREMLGEDIVGKQCFAGCYGAAEPCRKSSGCLVRQAFRYGTVNAHEATTRTREGETRYFKGRAKVISRSRSGEPEAVIKIYHDITEQKKAEERLRESLLQLRNNLAGTIQAMALTVETRDPYTAGHQRRTSDLARCIAREMGVSREQEDGIRMAGVIHDLGKISVPAEILSKPGKIGQTEYSLIKNHPETGFEILKGIDFRWPVAEIVRQHHERINGSGYPFGLAGDEIMLEARIIGVADVIEAMSSHRPYRPSLGIDEAFNEIRQNRGILYDPRVVDAAVHLYRRREIQIH